MAHITNRSLWAVSVRNNASLYREFPFSKESGDRAKVYLAELRQQGRKPTLKKLDEVFPHRKLARLAIEDLQAFIKRKLVRVALATVDRDIDVIAQALRYADDVWKIAPSESQLKGLRRPQYFNERGRFAAVVIRRSRYRRWLWRAC
ncbi:MAG: hypothetical protein BroJett001_33290 [Chloroflexota bacterium]|nr:MAG: hypothetical protein BroJett001_33290 [Chloroflexota bacterium]